MNAITKRNLFSLVRSGLALARVSFLRQRVPITMLWMVTNRCNLRCAYCCIPSREWDDMPTERCLSVLDEMAEAGTTRVGLLGGEPLLHKGIHDIVSRAKALGLMVQIYSNGYYVGKKLETVKLLDGLFISIDGPEEVHDALRGKGSYARAVGAIELAKPLVPVFILSVITNRSRHSLDYLVDLAKERNCLISFQTVTKLGDLSPDVSGLELNETELNEVFLKIRELRRRNPHVVTSETFINRVLDRRPDKPRDHYQMGSIKCWYGKALGNIDADGTVYTCSPLIGVEKGLNLRHTSFRRAWDHIGSTQCKGCNITCGGEYNVFLSLNPEAVKNVARIVWKVFVK